MTSGRSPGGSPSRLVGLLVVVVLAGALARAPRAGGQRYRAGSEYDVKLEDQGDDLRLAVFNLDLQHRNLALVGPSRKGIEDFDRAYDDLQVEIGRTRSSGHRLSRAGPAPRDGEDLLHDFPPATELYNSEPKQFAASDRGLTRLGRAGASSPRDRQAGREACVDRTKERGRGLEHRARAPDCARRGPDPDRATLAIRSGAHGRPDREAREALARALRAKMNFLADASHELRTPLP